MVTKFQISLGTDQKQCNTNYASIMKSPTKYGMRTNVYISKVNGIMILLAQDLVKRMTIANIGVLVGVDGAY